MANDLQATEAAPLSANDKALLNDMLTNTFNSVLRIEERALHNRLTEGLSVSELHTLAAVGMYERNPMSVIAARLGITLATLTVAMGKLEKKGYVERTRSELDRRQVLVRLTMQGRKALRIHDRFHALLVDDVLKGLSADEGRVLLGSLAKVKAFFDRQNELSR